MFCSVDKIDLAARVDGRPVAVQTDDRKRADIEAHPELTTLFAMARVLNARSHLAEEGHPDAAVHYALATDAPLVLREALAAVGATIERLDLPCAPPSGGVARSGEAGPLRCTGNLEPLGTASAYAAGALADRCFSTLARRAAARIGARDLAIALRMLEDQTFAAPPDRSDEHAYWCRVLELAALAGELLRVKFPGRWVQTDRALVPFGFQLAAGSAVMFPTNRAQRVIEDGRDETLFKLLVAAEETVHNPSDPDGGRLMPSLRARDDVQLDEIIWRPLLPEHAELPIIVCGIDGESTFGMIRREALLRPCDEALEEALANLADEPVDCEVTEARLAVVTGSFYAAEKLLDRCFMRQLHEMLDSRLLVASTPARGLLLVSADVDNLARFAALARARYKDSGGRAISTAIVLVSDGLVTGSLATP